jgi:hypothetical protein
MQGIWIECDDRIEVFALLGCSILWRDGRPARRRAFQHPVLVESLDGGSVQGYGVHRSRASPEFGVLGRKLSSPAPRACRIFQPRPSNAGLIHEPSESAAPYSEAMRQARRPTVTCEVIGELT